VWKCIKVGAKSFAIHHCNGSIVLLSKSFKQGLPWELLYSDDMVLLAEYEEKL